MLRIGETSAESLFARNKVLLIENAIDTDAIKQTTYTNTGICRISTSGRLCPPKNPAAFAKLAANFLSNGSVSFIWIGGGELMSDVMVDGQIPLNLTVTGWITSEEVSEHLQNSEIFPCSDL